MRILVGVVTVAMIVLAGPAVAQTPPAPSENCAGFDPAPTLPDGATATATQMTRGNEQYQAWGHERTAKLELCRVDVEALRAQADALAAAYNEATIELNNTTTAWQAEAAEFNERGASRRR